MPQPFTLSGLLRLAKIIRKIQGDRSIRKFAKDTGLNHTTVGRLLEGENIPDIPTLHKIAENSEYSTSYLVAILTQEVPEQVPCTLEEINNAAQNLPCHEKEQLILLLFQTLPLKKRRSIFDGLIDLLF